MKTYSLLGIFLLFFCAISFISCSKDDSECNDIPEKIPNEEPTASYYVKYEAKGSVMNYIESIIVTTDKESETVTHKRSWSQTYGPVSKGFKASITAIGGWPTVNIYVCRGEEPFVLKKTSSSGSSTSSTSASYTIDF